MFPQQEFHIIQWHHIQQNQLKKVIVVAICDQVEDPKSATGIVKREVTRVITPGTIIDVDFLDKNNNNYIACIKINTTENIAAIAYADITTGEFSVFEIKGKNFFEKALAEMNKIQASEILSDEKTYSEYIEIFKEKIIIFRSQILQKFLM